ncbi:hypothetical protein EVAR_92078_1 [Eumeta japonica]|uniref:Uncharacterized protein n=1 Tax=Eumeta variegata TaxID=151549 RepID=A0A4C1SZ46_EUMVA|nr:hypothetical protein EVAR_92078_1 [Eumeta japonica]
MLGGRLHGRELCSVSFGEVVWDRWTEGYGLVACVVADDLGRRVVVDHLVCGISLVDILVMASAPPPMAPPTSSGHLARIAEAPLDTD